ncbi:MAG: response regulator transcription factor [Pseudomonadota bacterium]
MSTMTVVSTSADTVFRHRLDLEIGRRGGITLVDDGWTGQQQLMRVTCEIRPDIFLVDRQCPQFGEALLPRHILKLSPATKIILFSETCGYHDVAEVIVNGVKGCVRKASPPCIWLKAIDAVYSGATWVDRAAMAEILETLMVQAHGVKPIDALPGQLTAREREVVCLVRRGMTNKEVARAMVICETTVKTHLKNIFDKLKITRRAHLPSGFASADQSRSKTTAMP